MSCPVSAITSDSTIRRSESEGISYSQIFQVGCSSSSASSISGARMANNRRVPSWETDRSFRSYRELPSSSGNRREITSRASALAEARSFINNRAPGRKLPGSARLSASRSPVISSSISGRTTKATGSSTTTGSGSPPPELSRQPPNKGDSTNRIQPALDGRPENRCGRWSMVEFATGFSCRMSRARAIQPTELAEGACD